MGRYQHLKIWLRERGCTFVWLGGLLGMTETGVRNMLMKERIAPERHAFLRNLGIPEELLPKSEKYVRRKRVPMLDAEGRILQVLPEGHDSTME